MDDAFAGVEHPFLSVFGHDEVIFGDHATFNVVVFLHWVEAEVQAGHDLVGSVRATHSLAETGIDVVGRIGEEPGDHAPAAGLEGVPVAGDDPVVAFLDVFSLIGAHRMFSSGRTECVSARPEE